MAQVEGKNPVLELLRSGATVRSIQVAQGLEGDQVIQEILRLAEDQAIPVELVSRRELRRLSTTGRDQHVIASTAPPSYASLERVLESRGKNVFVVILDGVQDPHNLGSILRTAEATGVDAVVIPRRESVGITPAVHRSSMGGSIHVPVARENLFEALELLDEEGIRTIAVDPSGSEDYFDVNLTGSLALVIGGEDKGISSAILKKCDKIVRIPMMGKLASLNVGVAVAVVMFDRVRQLKCEAQAK